MKGTAFSPHEGIYIQHLKTSKKNDMPVQHYHDAYEIYLQLDGRRLNKHYKEDISIDDISDAANMNKHYFCRQFKRTTGATALGYLHNIRLTRVHNLLLNTTMPLDEIAWETGFAVAATLARVFKAAYGVPPREFRKSSRESR